MTATKTPIDQSDQLSFKQTDTSNLRDKMGIWFYISCIAIGVMVWQLTWKYIPAESPSGDVGPSLETASEKFGSRLKLGNPRCTSNNSGNCRWRFAHNLSLRVNLVRYGAEGFITLSQHSARDTAADRPMFEQACRALVAMKLPTWTAEESTDFVNKHLVVGQWGGVRVNDTDFEFGAGKDGGRYCSAKFGY